MLLITSRENAHIKEYCKLKSSKKQRDMQNSFVLEGLKLTLEAYDNEVSIEKVFLTERVLKKYQEKLFELLNSGITVLQITDEVAKKMIPNRLRASLHNAASLTNFYLRIQ